MAPRFGETLKGLGQVRRGFGEFQHHTRRILLLFERQTYSLAARNHFYTVLFVALLNPRPWLIERLCYPNAVAWL